MSPFTLYMMMFIHHVMTATSNHQQTRKPSNLKYADTARRHANTEHLSSALSGLFVCLNYIFILLGIPTTQNV